MKLVRRLPPVLLAPMFISGGWDAALRPKGKAPKADAVTQPVIDALGLSADTEQLVRLNGGAQVVAGVMLASGILPRLAATVLAGSLIPTTYAGHRFWAEEDPQARAMQRIQFLKNLAMLGGLLLVATGPPSAPKRHARPKHHAGRKHHALRHHHDEERA
jgi:putative oxidoreductase